MYVQQAHKQVCMKPSRRASAVHYLAKGTAQVLTYTECCVMHVRFQKHTITSSGLLGVHLVPWFAGNGQTSGKAVSSPCTP